MMAAMKESLFLENELLLTNLGKELQNVLVSIKRKFQEINWKILTKDVFAKLVMEVCAGALFKTEHVMIVCIY